MLFSSPIDKPIHTSVDLTDSTTTSWTQRSKPTLCYYVNQTTQIQIIRISNCPIFYFERAVFPQQCCLFAAPKDAQIEVYTSEMASAVLLDRIPGEQLNVSIALDSPLAYQEVN